MGKEKTILKVLIVEPLKAPYVVEIDGSLESMQGIVGGLIQVIYPFDDPVALVCNDEGKLMGLPLNRPLVDSSGSIYDIIAGTFAVIGLDDEDGFRSLTDDELEKFSKLYAVPEMFIGVDGHIVAVPLA